MDAGNVFEDKVPNDISSDGRFLLFVSLRSKTGADLFVLPMDEKGKTGKPVPFLSTPFEERQGQFSPDVHWAAYESTESGSGYEVYVRPFPNVDDGHWQVSTSGGTRPAWSRNGRELFYYQTPGKILAVRIQPGATFAAGTPQVVVDGRYLSPQSGRAYDVSLDGKRFLLIKDATPVSTSAPSQLVVVLNWSAELKRLVPVR